MDMMRPVSLALPPVKPDGRHDLACDRQRQQPAGVTPDLERQLDHRDAFLVQRTTNGTTWTDRRRPSLPLNDANTHGTRTFTDTTSNGTTAYYRVVAQNTVGYGPGPSRA